MRPLETILSVWSAKQQLSWCSLLLSLDHLIITFLVSHINHTECMLGLNTNLLQVSMQAKDYYVSLVDIDAGHRLRALSSKKIGKLTRITAQVRLNIQLSLRWT